MKKIIKPKEREIIIQSLRSGVVPRLGIQHIQVGRIEELKSVLKDIDMITTNSSSFRIIIGEYGSGKTFFLSLARIIALEKGLVTVNADLSLSKRLYGRTGYVTALISDLISSMSTRSKPDGKALPMILDRLISVARERALSGKKDASIAFRESIQEIRDIHGGFSFFSVIMKYYEACETGNEVLKDNCLKWLRAEYKTKKDAAQDLGIMEYLDDTSLFSTLRVYAILVKKAGYNGLLICLDEMAVLYKLNGKSRNNNYEEILYIINNTIQGNVTNMGFIMSGTPEFLTDSHRGLYSYDALKSRLSENSFSKRLGLVDRNSVVLRLENLRKEDLYILLKNIRHVYAMGKEENYLVPDEALIAYMNYCANRIGDSYFRTPRNTIRGFLDLLSILEQYPLLKWSDVIDEIDIQEDIESSDVDEILSSQSKLSEDEEDEFATFKL
ncbi:MAG: ATP-binding protein [Prevotella sp.]|nr:ATP-binding protein [Prevotella sp.]